MRNNFLNIGNKFFVNVDMVKCIAAADSDKVRRILARADLTRATKEVIDSTSDKETRSILFMNDNTYCISSVNASVLAKRTQSDASEFIDENKERYNY